MEDDEWFADSLVASLGSDLVVKIVRDPEKIFAAIDAWQPDVLLADVILSAKNLFVLLNEMQSYTDTQQLPIVILSSVAGPINENDLREFNVRKVLDKASATPQMIKEALSSAREAI